MKLTHWWNRRNKEAIKANACVLAIAVGGISGIAFTSLEMYGWAAISCAVLALGVYCFD